MIATEEDSMPFAALRTLTASQPGNKYPDSTIPIVLPPETRESDQTKSLNTYQVAEAQHPTKSVALDTRHKSKKR